MRIAVLNLEIYRTLAKQDKLVHFIAQIWREQGQEVLDLYGTTEKVKADLLFLHVDLSLVPEEYRTFASCYPHVINGKVSDIRKSAYSSNRLLREDEWKGAVLVKTDDNFGGKPEKRLARERLRKNPLLALMGLANRNLAYRLVGGKLPPFDKYPVFASRDLVPEAWWGENGLLIEKFLPERDGEFYVLRKYCFLGNRSRIFRTWGKDPVVSTKTEEGTELLQEETPPELEELRRRMGLDYGKIDYGLVDGKCIVYDVNKTIGISQKFNPKVLEFAEYLAKGLEIWRH
jgi:hypothetical protein